MKKKKNDQTYKIFLVDKIIYKSCKMFYL